MSHWNCFHLDDTITAIVIAESFGRFLVRMREPAGGNRNPIEFYRGNLKEAQRAADRLVQAYYPHECDESRCGQWQQTDR
ncbi:MAG TPA: hypothetical protein VFM05_01155 [Candidatus Saccharimonadales bacterium]|nr:hypothetical protein [Candidatus Saccharimonadales bacterium]